MKTAIRNLAVVVAAGACLTVPVQRLTAQDAASADPMAELLTRLGEVEARIGSLQARYDTAIGEDRELFADQLARRWREHHTLLGELVAATESARETGTERPGATERIRLALEREAGFISAYADTVQLRIAEVRAARPDTPAEDLFDLELQLTDLEGDLDRLVEAATADIERAAVVGLDLGPRVVLFDRFLEDRAATVGARIELAMDQRAMLTERAGRAGADTVAIRAELNALEEKLRGTTSSLTTTVDLLDRRGLETAAYRQLLLESTGDFGVDILDPEVVGGLVGDRWESVREWLTDNATTILLKVATILLILLIFGVLAGLTRRLVRRILAASRVETTELLRRLVVGMASKLIWFVGFLVVLSVFGVNIGPMLAGLGIAGFVLGFALQDTLSNFASGMMIMFYHPFDVGDLVTVGGVTGTVEAVTLVSTVITTLDNQLLIVPNNKVWGDVIKNVTAKDTRRVDLVFGIGYEDDIPKARAIMEDVLREHELVLEDPESVVRVYELGDSSVNFICRPWCRTDDYWTVYLDVTETVKRRFDEDGVSIPFPQRDVHVYQQDAGAGMQ